MRLGLLHLLGNLFQAHLGRSLEDICFDTFTKEFVRHTDTYAVAHTYGHQRFLNFHRADLLTAHIDHLFGSAGKIHITIF